MSILFAASEADRDFDALTMPVAFRPGFPDGDTVCVNVTVLADAMIERVMNFTVELTLDTVGDSLSLGNDATLVVLVDSDGNEKILPRRLAIIPLLSFSVAFFSIPADAAVAESDSIVEVCVTLTTFPMGAELTKQADLTLSTMSGSGKLRLHETKLSFMTYDHKLLQQLPTKTLLLSLHYCHSHLAPLMAVGCVLT